MPAGRTAETLALLALADGATLPVAAAKSGLSLARVEALARQAWMRTATALAEGDEIEVRDWPAIRSVC